MLQLKKTLTANIREKKQLVNVLFKALLHFGYQWQSFILSKTFKKLIIKSLSVYQ